MTHDYAFKYDPDMGLITIFVGGNQLAEWCCEGDPDELIVDFKRIYEAGFNNASPCHDDLVEALDGYTKKCSICHGSGEYEQWPHLSPSEVDEIVKSGEELPKSKIYKCTNCKDSIDLLAKARGES